MRRNIWALGDRSVSGQMGRVMSAGDITAINSTFGDFKGAGDVTLRGYLRQM